MPFSQDTNTHAMCDYYGHEWKKHTLLSSKQKSGYIVEVCQRSGCDAARRVWRG